MSFFLPVILSVTWNKNRVLDPEKTVKEIVQEGVQPILDLLAEYEAGKFKIWRS